MDFGDVQLHSDAMWIVLLTEFTLAQIYLSKWGQLPKVPAAESTPSNV